MNNDFNKFYKSYSGKTDIGLYNYINATHQPVILEQTQLKATAVDVFSRLMMDRIVFLGDSIDNELSNIITAQLLWLNTNDNKTPIQLYINSPGGSVIDGLQIYDTMKLIKSPVHTICTGLSASMAAILLSGGDKRASLPHSRIMIHQPRGGVVGTAIDMDIANKEMQNIKKVLVDILSNNTNKSPKQISKDIDRDNWMTAKEALDYGLIDEICNKNKSI